MKIPLRYRFLLPLIPVLIAVLSYIGVFQPTRNSVGDVLFSEQEVPSDIVILAIDERSIHDIGQWPWPRGVFGRAVSRLQSARAIGVDVNFKEPSRLGLSDDASFAQALSASRVPVVLASELQPDGKVIEPISVLASVSLRGLANVTIDPDGIVRSIRLQRNNMPFLGAQIARAGGASMAFYTTPHRINYLGPAGSIPTYAFIDLITGAVPGEVFTDKLVLIGATARDLQDYQNTPVGLMSGVEIQANVTANTLANNFIKTFPIGDALFTFFVGFLALIVAHKVRRIGMVIVVAGILVIIVWLSVFSLFSYGILADLVMPTLAIMVSTGCMLLVHYAITAHERRFIHDTFSRYLAPQVIEELLRDPSLVRLGGERRELTILFSDIRGFTTLSEHMQPQQLGHFLNRYLSRMTDIVLNQHGVIDKYIGDAIMAFWGVPLDDKRHALHGVLSAMAMTQALERFNRDSMHVDLPAIAIGIGLNTGTVTVGNMGSERRFDYTVIGDEVNLASRLESLTKTYSVSIIVSDNVIKQISLEEQQQYDLRFREIDRVRVKGKTQPVTIFEVMTRAIPQLELFSKGRLHYYAGQWQEAIRAFDAFLAVVGEDGPAQLLKERCQGFLHHPAEGWEGVFEMQHK